MTNVMEGPLAPWAPGLAERLRTLGYTRRTAERQMLLARGLSEFLGQRGSSAAVLSPELIEQFLSTIRWSWRPTPKTLVWLFDY